MVALLKMKTKLGVRGSEQIENTYTSVENRLKKKLKLDVSSPTSIRMESVWRETSAANETSKSPANTGMKEITPQEAPRAGRWSLDEKIMFLYGLSKYGKGRWKKISVYVPDR